MHIRFHGHACFEFVSEIGRSLLFDPFKPDALNGRFNLPPIEAVPDWIAITHYHEDHCWLRAEWSHIPVLDQSTALPNIHVEAIPAYHDGANRGTKMGLSSALRVQFGGINIVHLGDLNERLSEETLSMLERPAVLLLPVGGTYTIGAEEGLELTKRLQPGWVVPMHGADPRINLPLEPVSLFNDLWDGPVHRLVGASWKADLGQPGEETVLLPLEAKGLPSHGKASPRMGIDQKGES